MRVGVLEVGQRIRGNWAELNFARLKTNGAQLTTSFRAHALFFVLIAAYLGAFYTC